MALTFADLPTDVWEVITSYLSIDDVITCYHAGAWNKRVWLICYLQRLSQALDQWSFYLQVAQAGWCAVYRDSLQVVAQRRRSLITWRLLAALAAQVGTWTARQEKLLRVLLAQPNIGCNLRAVYRHILLNTPLTASLIPIVDILRQVPAVRLVWLTARSRWCFDSVMSGTNGLLQPLSATCACCRGKGRESATFTAIYAALHSLTQLLDGGQAVLQFLSRLRQRQLPLSRRCRRRLWLAFLPHQNLQGALIAYPYI